MVHGGEREGVWLVEHQIEYGAENRARGLTEVSTGPAETAKKAAALPSSLLGGETECMCLLKQWPQISIL